MCLEACKNTQNNEGIQINRRFRSVTSKVRRINYIKFLQESRRTFELQNTEMETIGL